MGRFTTEDSYWGEDDNPLSLNLYTYCENDPVNFTDPTGHSILGDIIKTIGNTIKEVVKTVTGATKNSSSSSSSSTSKSSSSSSSSSGSKSSSSSGSSSGISANELEFFCGKGASLVYGEDGNYRTGTVPMFKDGKIIDVDCSKAIDMRNLNGYIIMTSDTILSGNIDNYSRMDTLNIADNSYAKVNNYGVMDTINLGKNSSLFLDNYGKINKGTNIGENGTAVIVNNKGAYIKDVIGGDITDGTKKGMYIENRGTIDYVLTGKNSHNEINNYDEVGAKLTLETGEGNNTIIIIKIKTRYQMNM